MVDIDHIFLGKKKKTDFEMGSCKNKSRVSMPMALCKLRGRFNV